MKVIVGLGNPGKAYLRTPHNVGFEVVDLLARRLDCSISRSLRFQASTGKAVANGKQVLLVEPRTFMNNSGAAVGPLLRVKGAEPGDLVVVLDDADLARGRVRIRAKGGSGGHKGLASIIAAIGTEDFARVRIGIGKDENGADLAEHVLKPFSAGERKEVEEALDRAADAVMCILDEGVDAAMNKFNA